MFVIKKVGKNIDKNLELLFMHCVSEYPSPMHHSNLNAIKRREKTKVPIGLSDIQIILLLQF